MMGNVVVWKPADTQIYAANVIMQVFKEAGVPDGVINLIYADGPVVGDEVFNHPDFAGIHFTGSTKLYSSTSGKPLVPTYINTKLTPAL
jgi:1-pyrroline-5-carboxylate dehydrogenase